MSRSEGGKTWDRVKGTPGQTHPSPKVALYIDEVTERVNKLLQQHPDWSRRYARRQAQKERGL